MPEHSAPSTNTSPQPTENCGAEHAAGAGALRRSRGRIAISTVTMLLALSGSAAPAQPAPGPTAAQPAGVAAAPVAAPDQMKVALSSLVATFALVDLRLNPAPQRRDFLVASALLTDACRLAPTDTILRRLAVDAAAAGEDGAALDEHLRALVKLDPADAGSQLNLINRLISSQQTAKGRLELYDRFLGPKGATIDPSIRSRLALDSALLLRERGDSDTFLKRLLMATQLDSSNAEAASLYADSLIPALTDPSQRFELLANTVLADPLEARTHMRVGRFLASSRAPVGALRFFRIAEQLEMGTGREMHPAEKSELYVQRWLIEGPIPVATEIGRLINNPRKLIEEERARRVVLNQELFGLPEVTDLQLAFEMSVVRTSAALAARDEALFAAAVKDIGDTIALRRSWLADAAKRPKSFSIEAINEEINFWLPQYLTFKLMHAMHDDKPLDGELVTQVGTVAEGSPLRARLDALVLAKTEMFMGMEKLAALAGSDPVSAVARAWLMDRPEQDKSSLTAVEAIADYQKIVDNSPGTVFGAFAETRLKALGAPLPAAPAVAKLEAMAAAAPKSLELYANSPGQRASVIMEANSKTVGPMDRIILKARLRNTSNMPLAIGVDRAISNRAILAPSIRLVDEAASDYVTSEPVGFDRKLRLLPGEDVSVDIWADGGFSGWAVGNYSAASQRISYRLLQGFYVDNDGMPRISPTGFSADVSGILRTSFPSELSQTATAPAAIEAASGMALLNAVAAIRPALIATGSSGDPAATKIMTALSARYAKANAMERAAILCLVPHANLAPIAVDFDAAVLTTAETDPLVKKLLLVSRAAKQDSPLLAAGAADADASVRDVAALHQQRLARQDIMLATTTTLRRRALEVIRQFRDPNADKDTSKTDRPGAESTRPDRPSRPGAR